MALINIENISKVYRTETVETLALDNVSLTVDKGEFVSVMGPSGCGKSTLLNIIGILDTPTSGKINLETRRWRHFATSISVLCFSLFT